MREPPPGWASCLFSELGQIRLGKMLDKSKNTGVPVKYLRNINVRWFRFDLSDIQTILLSEDERDALSIRDGDLLICEGGEPGRAAVWRGGANDLTFQKALHRMRVASGIEPELLMYRLRADAESGHLSDAFTGTTIKHLTGESLAVYPTSIPPAAEQLRLVKKISRVLARVDACHARLDRVPQILKRFREAVLEAAVSGRLTEKWRTARGISRHEWSAASIGDLVQKIEAGLNVQCDERPPERGEKGLVKISAVTWGEFDEDESKTLPKDSTVTEAVRIMKGDLLISRANTLEFVGACVIVDSITRQLYLSDKVLRLRAEEHIKPWLLISLRSRSGRLQIETLASGNQLSMRNLSQANLRSMTVVLPSSDERIEIVRRVDALMAIAHGLEEQHAAAVDQVKQITSSVLAKAFRGELVSQDPNDEPAVEMLQRIKSERKETGVKAKTKVVRRTARAATTEAPDQAKAAGQIETYTLTRILKKRGRMAPAKLLDSSGLSIDDFYDQLKLEESKHLLKEVRKGKHSMDLWIEAVK